MEILHVSDYLTGYHKIWGGAEQACLRLLNLLQKKGYKINIVSSKPLKKSAHPYNLFFIGTLEEHLPNKLKPIYCRIRPIVPVDLVALIQFYRLILKLKPDILHLHNFKILTFSMVWAANILKVPVVVSIYDYWYFCPKEILLDGEGKTCFSLQGFRCAGCLGLPLYCRYLLELRRIIFNFFLKRIDKFIVLSQSSAEIMRRYGVAKEKISIVYQPSLAEETSPEQINLSLKNPFLLLVGGFALQKGLHIAIEVLAYIKRKIPNITLYIAGAVKESANKKYVRIVNQLIQQNKVENSVFFLGKQSPAELRYTLIKADVIIVTEQWVNMSPVVLMEAMAQAKPIVASRIGGIPEFIKDGENGFLANPGEPYEFSQKVIWVLEHPEEAKKLGERASKDAKRVWDDEINLNKTVKIYESLLKS